MCVRLEKRPRKGTSSEAGDFVTLWISDTLMGSTGRSGGKTQLSATEWINKRTVSPEPQNVSVTDGSGKEIQIFNFLQLCEMCLTASLESFESLLLSSQINFVESLLLMRTSSSRSLALTCLYSLYSTAKGERSSFCTFLMGTRQQTFRNGGGSAVECKWCECLFIAPLLSFYLPFCRKNCSSNSFRFLRSLFFSSRVSWSCSTSSSL